MDVDILKSYIKELRKGSHKAFNAIYDMYADKLFGFAFAHTKSREMANDIVQDTFLKLWTMRETLLEDRSLQALLFAITHNKMIDMFRTQINKVEFEDYIEYAESAYLDDNATEKKIYYDDFLKALKLCKSLLPLRQIEIFEMNRELGKSIEEIANQLKISEQTVKNQLTSAMKTLRTELVKYNLVYLLLLEICFIA
ncbi:MAG: RNA polymerase sigma-70 factor [Paludibacter sp.]|nr:RNA polymerase sigma-70 factor [Paludibacter sp.]